MSWYDRIGSAPGRATALVALALISAVARDPLRPCPMTSPSPSLIRSETPRITFLGPQVHVQRRDAYFRSSPRNCKLDRT